MWQGFVRVWNLVAYTEGRTRTDGVWQQGAEEKT
jgi:hypothetical protein